MTDFRDLGDTPYERIRVLMEKLRTPNTGCPWDVEQTFETIAPYTIEEAYEVSDAINQGDMAALKEELGDLIFQVVFHARMAEEQGAFNLDDVCDGLTDKMVRRHPHVFAGEDQRESAEAQLKAWEDVKAQERAQKGNGKPKSVLDDVALALPALTRAEKLQKRAARVGFDWPTLKGVTDKISEEAQELAEASNSMDEAAIVDEMGDLLFAVTNLARKLGVDPEQALRQTNQKFTGRFQHIEQRGRDQDKPLTDMSLDEMEGYWQDAKTQ